MSLVKHSTRRHCVDAFLLELLWRPDELLEGLLGVLEMYWTKGKDKGLGEVHAPWGTAML